MSMGRRKREVQGQMFIAISDLPATAGHPFYEKLNCALSAMDFDRRVEDLCHLFYVEDLGRASIPPGVYFRMLLIGYFEGIDSERGIAWRVAGAGPSFTQTAFCGAGSGVWRVFPTGPRSISAATDPEAKETKNSGSNSLLNI